MPPFFVLACARSGSTSLARILDDASNGACAVEPVPNLNVETRLAHDGRLADAGAVVGAAIVPRVQQGLATHEVYGEKNVTYGPFIPELHAQTGARFVYMKRDGRDVVRSMLNWHDALFGNVYRECGDPGDLTPRALAAAAALPVHEDTSDFARPRPRPGSKWYEVWETLSRFEMCAYYWATTNDLYRSQLETLPDDAWIEIDYTRPTADDVLRVAEFCGLRGLDREDVTAKLVSRINSLQDRTGESGRHAAWMDWDGGQRRRFEAIAGDAMRRLGYFGPSATQWRPARYGTCWEEHAADEAWYEWMYDSRRSMHEEAVAWIRGEDDRDRIESIADFGCGLAVGYAEALSDRRYDGFDLISSSIEWCRVNRSNADHAYHHLDFIAEPTPRRYDVVMSSGTIDNGYDVEAFLDAMIRASTRWIYLTCYRGWFPDLAEHRYGWVDKDECFYTDIAPRRVREHLERCGCDRIRVEPVRTGRDDIPLETRIIARVPAAGHGGGGENADGR